MDAHVSVYGVEVEKGSGVKEAEMKGAPARGRRIFSAESAACCRPRSRLKDLLKVRNHGFTGAWRDGLLSADSAGLKGVDAHSWDHTTGLRPRREDMHESAVSTEAMTRRCWVKVRPAC